MASKHDEDRRERRASPSYGSYEQTRIDQRRLTPEAPLQPPPPSANGQHEQQQQWKGRGPSHPKGEDWIEQRRQQRAQSTATCWAPSPPRPERSPSPEHRLVKRSTRPRSLSSSSSSSSDSEEERRRRKHRRKESSRHRSSKSSRRKRSPSPVVSKSKSRRDEYHDEGGEEWVEAPPRPPVQEVVPVRPTYDDSDEEIGPAPPPHILEKPRDPRDYGRAMLRGEGAAMAAFAADGARIPRRGEIGMGAEEIDKFERAGYVMSGSRNKKMNEVRMRKENQVISAEEKRGLLQMQKEEKVKREADIIASFREMVDASLAPKKTEKR